MKILVTGGHGFVGSALTRALREKYPRAKLFVPTSSECNLFNENATRYYVKENKPDFCFHLASRLGGVGLVSNRPLAFLEDNLRINMNLLRGIESAGGVTKLITLGSSCCYSAEAPLPNREADLWKGHPENTYGICKLVLLEELLHQSEGEWVYLIPPNIYGPGDHFGEENAHFIPTTVMKFKRAAEEGAQEIEVWGDGTQTRDFVYIDDMVHFLLSALEDERYVGRPINVGTGVEVSVRETVEYIREIMGLTDRISIRWAPNKPTGTKRKVLNNATLRALAPEYVFTDIEEGLKRTIQAWI